MSDIPYEREPLHSFVRGYLKETGRPVVTEKKHHFVAKDAEGVESAFTYSPATLEQLGAEQVTLLASGNRTLERFLDTAIERGSALRGRAKAPVPAVAAGRGCAAFPVCGTLPQQDRCQDCPDGAAVRVLLPVDARMRTADDTTERLVLRFVFELEVRGPETLRDVVVIEVGEVGEPRVLERGDWEDLSGYEPHGVGTVDGDLFDRLSAVARATANALLDPAVAMAEERANAVMTPILVNLRARAEAERREAPAEASSIDAHLRREEAALLERNSVAATSRLVGVLALEAPVAPLIVELGRSTRTIDRAADCERCSTSSSELVIDESAHLVCGDCTDLCFTCGTSRCLGCADGVALCPICRTRPCAACSVTCSDCGTDVCSPDADACATCSAMSCFACQERCSYDQIPVCQAHVTRCVGGEPLCESHVVPAVDAPACNEHSGECATCSRVFSDAESVTTKSGKRVCRQDGRSCADCPKGTWHAGDEGTSCNVGKEWLCVAHQVACSAGDVACERHSKTCERRHRMCTSHVVACALGQELMCREHAVACAACAKATCQTHHVPCSSCGDRLCTEEPRPICAVCRAPGCERCRKGDRCGTCSTLRPVMPGEDLPAIVTKNLDPAGRLLIARGRSRLVAVQLGRIRSQVLVADSGKLEGMRPMGFLERRSLGL